MTDDDGPITILHVDDDPDLGELVALYLERNDDIACSVSTETSPVEALARIRSDESFDVVISDYNMPEMNGIEFLESLRETHPELPVLLFSGEETNDIAAEIIRAGVTDYLRKGFGSDQYTKLVRRVARAVDSDGQFDPEAETELDGVGVVGTDDRFDTADDTYASYYQYSADEIVGKHWTELHPEPEVDHIREHVLPVVEDGGKWTGRSEGLRSDGSTFAESKMVTSLDDGRLLIAVSELAEPGESTTGESTTEESTTEE
ncbi:response regulator [Halosimplex halobium]|uniref:response regulator n=1 Tax=Halosimplex halobium TaxID=3396618 RepID=UPI003F55C01E